MKRKPLEDMGLTKEQIDSITAENGSDIEPAKGDLEQTKVELEQTKAQLQERDTQMETLKSSIGNMDALKQQIASLQSDNQVTKEKYEADMKELKLSTSIKLALGDSAQDTDPVAGLFDKSKPILPDDGKITGLDEQLGTIKESRPFLFKKSSPKPSGFRPLGADPQDPKPNNDDSKASIKSAIEAKITPQLSQQKNQGDETVLITLEEARKNVQNGLQMGVIDEFRKSNWILDHITFDDAVSPTGGGATPTHSYTRLKTQSTAQFRAINTEYTPSEATKERHSVDIKAFGGSYQIDRMITNISGIVSEVELQQSQKTKMAQALSNDTFINGDEVADTNVFDGLDKALTGSITEYNAGDTVIDLPTSQLITDNFQYFLDMLDEFLRGLDGEPSFIAGNTKLIPKLRARVRRAAMYQATKSDWGINTESYGNIPLVDLGARPGTNDDVAKTDTTKGMTSLYVTRLPTGSLHGVSLAGMTSVQTWLPDFTTAGAVETGEVEMNAATALEAFKAAGVSRNIKVK